MKEEEAEVMTEPTLSPIDAEELSQRIVTGQANLLSPDRSGQTQARNHLMNEAGIFQGRINEFTASLEKQKDALKNVKIGLNEIGRSLPAKVKAN